MARPVLVGSIDGHPHLHNLVTRSAQLATLLATDLIIGLCKLDSLDTRVSTSDDEIEVCGPIGGPLIWTIAQSGPWLVALQVPPPIKYTERFEPSDRKFSQ